MHPSSPSADAYLKATMTDRAKITGVTCLTCSPTIRTTQQADGVRNLRASLERARQTRQADVVAACSVTTPRAAV
jgi:two-component system, cell cycle sensor histidine kinase and response regulator CckA